ncbi:uncharacterized protein [Lolium perenne]|uniref:uncharacterized protein n=1 Tax=Lolium perenne TaxID=4522 RepID=UPI003A99CF3A
MQRNEALMIAYIDVFEIIKNGNPSTEYYSKLVKAGIHGKDKICLPGPAGNHGDAWETLNAGEYCSSTREEKGESDVRASHSISSDAVFATFATSTSGLPRVLDHFISVWTRDPMQRE